MQPLLPLLCFITCVFDPFVAATHVSALHQPLDHKGKPTGGGFLPPGEGAQEKYFQPTVRSHLPLHSGVLPVQQPHPGVGINMVGFICDHCNRWWNILLSFSSLLIFLTYLFQLILLLLSTCIFFSFWGHLHGRVAREVASPQASLSAQPLPPLSPLLLWWAPPPMPASLTPSQELVLQSSFLSFVFVCCEWVRILVH